MSIILDVSDMLDAARDILPPAEVEKLEADCVAAAQRLAERIAQAEGITCTDVSHQGGFGGLCASFRPGPDGKTSDLVASYDDGGEWT